MSLPLITTANVSVDHASRAKGRSSTFKRKLFDEPRSQPSIIQVEDFNRTERLAPVIQPTHHINQISNSDAAELVSRVFEHTNDAELVVVGVVPFDAIGRIIIFIQTTEYEELPFVHDAAVKRSFPHHFYLRLLLTVRNGIVNLD